MKKCRILSLVLVVILLSLALVGCGQAEAGSTAGEVVESTTGGATVGSDDPIKVGVIVTTTKNEFCIQLVNAVTRDAEKYGIEVVSDGPKEFADYAAQTQILENYITQEVDFVLIEANHPESIGVTVEKALAAGIPVISVDAGPIVNADNEPLDVASVGTDNVVAAYDAAKYAFDQIGGSGRVVYIEGEAGNAVAEWRKEGVHQAVAEYPGIELLASQDGGWTVEGGMAVMENVLQTTKDVDCIVSANTNEAQGAIRAIKAAGIDIADVYVMGFDLFPQDFDVLRSGEMDATVAQNINGMADWGLRYGLAYINYFKDAKSFQNPDDPAKPFPVRVDSGITFVTAENIDEVAPDFEIDS